MHIQIVMKWLDDQLPNSTSDMIMRTTAYFLNIFHIFVIINLL